MRAAYFATVQVILHQHARDSCSKGAWRIKVSYRERMAAVGRMPTTASRNEHGENLREAATADAVESSLQALLPPGIASPMQVPRSDAVPRGSA